MYLRVTKSGGHEYVSLAQSHRDGVGGPSRAKIIYNFGRKDNLDFDELRRLIGSIERFLPEDLERVVADGSFEKLVGEFVGAKRLGETHALDGVWHKLGLPGVLGKLVQERDFAAPIERLLFALVAQRAINPGSKLAVEAWVRDEAYIAGLPEVEVQQLYRAMDFLLEAHDAVQREVYRKVSNLFNLEVDVLFIDTTSTYFEIEEEDADEDAAVGGDSDGDDNGAVGADTAGDDGAVVALRKRSRHSKDKRPDLPQAVIGFAVTRSGIPVRCWVWPGNTVDVSLIEEIKRDLNEWKLGRIVTVMDTGFNSAANRKVLQGAGDAFIIGERMRLGPDGKLPEALQRAGRYQTLASGLRIKEVTTQQGSVVARRFVVVHNPEQAQRDQLKRDDIIKETERRLAQLQQLDGKAHSKAACDLRAHTTFWRYLRQTKTGKLKLDKSKIATEEKLDGKYLISSSDPYLSAEEIALGYKQLHEIERLNRDLKHTVDVRPVYHRRSDRIKAHVLLCWLALLLIRIAELETNRSWHQLKGILHPLSASFRDTEQGTLIESSRLTNEQKSVLDALNVKAPLRILDFPTPETRA